MAWREFLIRHFGPGLLPGITLGDWLRLLSENRFAVSPWCLLRALGITSGSLSNGLMAWYEEWRYGREWKEVEVLPPLFVLGHWRSGTTHLHNLVAVDERFAFPNNYQTLYPHTYLTTEAVNSRVIGFFFPRRRPMDNIEWDLRSPQEDEFTLNMLCFKSPCMGWVFPRRRDHYDRYLTFRGVPADEVAVWQATLMRILKKLTWKHRRPLALKSPPHTCRIRLLLQLFPKAKFVHIRRNPYAVFVSARKTFQVNGDISRLQPRPDDLDGWILRQYRAMYDAYFEERGLISAGNFHEVAFEELEADPIGQMRRMYEALGLPEFAHVEPALRRYVESIAGYRKNEFPELPAELRGRIAAEWRRSFEVWGYAV
jgi:hypothetical protein